MIEIEIELLKYSIQFPRSTLNRNPIETSINETSLLSYDDDVDGDHTV